MREKEARVNNSTLNVKAIIGEKTLTIIVCDTCRSIIAQLGNGSCDGTIASLEARNHPGHSIITLNRTDGNYLAKLGLHLRPEYVQ